MDRNKSPFETVADHEVQARVEQELRNVPEPYRTTVVLHDIEDLSYEQIGEITQVSLGTVKSRISRGRNALRKLLADYIREVGTECSASAGNEECVLP
jgi:RNA polymerase sigma-70 factor (ECF subfamily)